LTVKEHKEKNLSTIEVRLVVTGALLVVLLLSGFWTTRAGKPYRTFPFTVHKLFGLAAGILLAIIAYKAHQAAPLGLVEIAAIAVTVLLFLGTVAAGGLLSVDEQASTIVLRLHQVLPVLSLLSTAGMLYLLLRGR
jgi:hypothetical protein